MTVPTWFAVVLVVIAVVFVATGCLIAVMAAANRRRVFPEPYTPSRRDRIAVPIVNLASHLATPHYRRLVQGSIEYGMRAAARDNAEGREAPPDWRGKPLTEHRADERQHL